MKDLEQIEEIKKLAEEWQRKLILTVDKSKDHFAQYFWESLVKISFKAGYLALLTRLKAGDLGEVEWDWGAELQEGIPIPYLKTIGLDLIGKRGRLYFIPEEE